MICSGWQDFLGILPVALYSPFTPAPVLVHCAFMRISLVQTSSVLKERHLPKSCPLLVPLLFLFLSFFVGPTFLRTVVCKLALMHVGLLHILGPTALLEINFTLYKGFKEIDTGSGWHDVTPLTAFPGHLSSWSPQTAGGSWSDFPVQQDSPYGRTF